jgi:S-DNA-T family DNA segregation ATPase FtsK/SpoIIIE
LPKRKSPQTSSDRLVKDLLAIACLTLGAFLLAALVFEAQGYEGLLTRALARWLSLALGAGAYLIPLIAFMLAAFYGLESPPAAPARILIGITLLVLAILTALHLHLPAPAEVATDASWHERWGYLFEKEALFFRGGYVGAALAFVLLLIVGPVGGYILLAGVSAAALILVSQGTLPLVLSWLRRQASRGLRAANGRVDRLKERRIRRPGPRQPHGDSPRRKAGGARKAAAAVADNDGPNYERDLFDDDSPQSEARNEPAAGAEGVSGEAQGEGVRQRGQASEPALGDSGQAADETPPAAESTAPKATSRPRSSGTSSMAGTPRRKPRQPALLESDDLYQLPSPSLLTDYPDEVESREDRALAAENIIKVEDTLDSFGITAKVTHYERGPVLTRYEVEPERGIRVNKVSRLTDDLRLALAAWDVRVEAPIPGKSAIGIEVPNQKRSTVGLRALVESDDFIDHSSHLAAALGRDIAGHPVIADLTHMPHLLVAGATNSGKSVCLHSIIVSLLMRAKPSEVQLIMVDPKRVELNLYEGMPHLMSPVVHTVQQAVDVLRKAIREMEKRYEQFAKVSAANIAEYNFFTAGARVAAGKLELPLETLQKRLKLDESQARRLMDMMEWGNVVVAGESPDDPWRVVIDEGDHRSVPLPRVVIIIDELADLMMQAKAEFEFSICRIAQLARATGIHLVIATQRPSVKVVTGNIKANVPSRIALSVASQVDSRTILDQVGAERLIGRGDMLYAPIDASQPRRVQGAFVSRQEIEAVAEHCRQQGEPNYAIIPEVPEEDDYSTEAEPTDELYADAVRYVVTEGEASVSMLQRRFKVGYARAGRLIDMMQQRGVVGPSQGSKPRQVLIGSDFVEAALGGACPAGEAPQSAFDDLPEPDLNTGDDDELDDEFADEISDEAGETDDYYDDE